MLRLKCPADEPPARGDINDEAGVFSSWMDLLIRKRSPSPGRCGRGVTNGSMIGHVGLLTCALV